MLEIVPVDFFSSIAAVEPREQLLMLMLGNVLQIMRADPCLHTDTVLGLNVSRAGS
jgi:hypothetical protein